MRPEATPPDLAALDALRAEIDGLDDALHAALMRRAALVAELARSRAKADGRLLRPGREAQVLRRLLDRHDGALPRAALVRHWREIFAASTALQGGLRVAACEDAAAEATRHFGPDTPLSLHGTPAQALAALEAGKASVAVLPWPRDDMPPAIAWWAGLDSPRVQVIARLPFLASVDAAADVALVGLGAADPSGDDRTLLRLELGAPLDRAALADRLAAAGLVGHGLASQAGGTLALADVAGAVAPTDPRLAALGATPLGFYATPYATGAR